MPASPAIRPPRVDSHQHFWKYDPPQYPWIQSDWPIRKSFLPSDLKPLLNSAGFDACIAVQARQTWEETHWLLDLANDHSFIAGVVGWVDIGSEEFRKKIPQSAKLVGVRHVVQDELDDEFMLRPDFVRGLAQLKDFSLAYDLLIFPKQLPAAIKLVNKFSEQRFVLDHIAKPFIREAQLDPWREQIHALAKSPNVHCKLSGLVTEARWRDWKPDEFRPYLDVVWEAFGEDRLMIGSDWPVCLLSAEYAQTMGLITSYLSPFSPATQDKILGGTATCYYKLKF